MITQPNLLPMWLTHSVLAITGIVVVAIVAIVVSYWILPFAEHTAQKTESFKTEVTTQVIKQRNVSPMSPIPLNEKDIEREKALNAATTLPLPTYSPKSTTQQRVENVVENRSND